MRNLRNPKGQNGVGRAVQAAMQRQSRAGRRQVIAAWALGRRFRLEQHIAIF